MFDVLRILTLIFGTLSLVNLIKIGFLNNDFAAPLEVILAYYNNVTSILFGWIRPYLNHAVNWLFSLYGFKVEIYVHWKDVFVLLWLYFGGTARNALKGDWEGAKTTAAIRMLGGGVIALIAATLTGTVSTQSSYSDFLLVGIPVLAIVLFRIMFALRFAWERYNQKGLNFLKEFGKKSVVATHSALLGLPLVLIATFSRYVPQLNNLPIPGLAILTVLVILISTYHLGIGAVETSKKKLDSETWLQAYLKQGQTQLGIATFQVIGGAVFFLLINAGIS